MKALLKHPPIRRDAVRFLRAAFQDRDLMVRTAEALPAFKNPALVIWAADDRVMPPDHGRRLAELFPQGRLIEIEDTATLIPLDQPAELARAVREFASSTSG